MSENDEINLPVDAFEPNRERVTIDAGAFVQQGNTVYRIAQVLDFESIIGIAVETGRSTPLAVAELRPVATDKESAAAPELTEIADPDWREAERRFAAIQPLLGRYMVGRIEVAGRAKEIGVDTATLYRWLQRYRATESVVALIPKKRGWRTGKPWTGTLASKWLTRRQRRRRGRCSTAPSRKSCRKPQNAGVSTTTKRYRPRLNA